MLGDSIMRKNQKTKLINKKLKQEKILGDRETLVIIWIDCL